MAAIAAVLIVRLTSPESLTPSRMATGPQEMPVGSAAPAPDISNMTPRERADRLYNRIMTAAESGDSTRVRFLVPMAIQAYQLLGGLDVDARYHVGMIQLVSGNYRAAASQADSIARVKSGNLLATALRAEIATRKGDQAARTSAYRTLLANYDKEIASGSADYADHREVLERLRGEALKTTK